MVKKNSMKDIITLIELFIAVFIVPTVGMLIGSYVVMGLEKRNKRNRGRCGYLGNFTKQLFQFVK